jgi:hypothetical protein
MMALVVMVWQKVITVAEFAIAMGSILSFYVTLSKDDHKVETKDKFKVMDPPPKSEFD